MKYIISISFLCLGQSVLAQMVFYGTISEQKKPIDAQLVAVVGNRKQPLGKASGDFKVALESDMTALQIEAKGYRPLYMPLFFDTPTTGSMAAILTMLPIGKQTNNKPFDQSEQQRFELTNINSKNNTSSTRTFKIVDGFSNKAIGAELCLFYTQTSQKKCYTLNATGAEATVVFSQKDIIAIEVLAQGYQKYNGNLIIDNLDNQKQLFEIGLNKIPTYLSVATPTLTEGQQLRIKADDGAPIVLKAVDSQHWFGGVVPQKKYTVEVLDTKTNSSLFSTDFMASDGLHLITASWKNKVEEIIKQEPPTQPVIVLPQEQRIIYFEQSDCIIRPNLLSRLDTVALWLKQNPDIKIRLAGYTDDVGDPKLNIILSELRAKAVHSYLFNKGIAENRILSIGLGGKYPAKPNDIETNKAMNRRVEIGYINR